MEPLDDIGLWYVSLLDASKEDPWKQLHLCLMSQHDYETSQFCGYKSVTDYAAWLEGLIQNLYTEWFYSLRGGVQDDKIQWGDVW